MTRCLVTKRTTYLLCTVVLLCLFGTVPDELSIRLERPQPSTRRPPASLTTGAAPAAGHYNHENHDIED